MSDETPDPTWWLARDWMDFARETSAFSRRERRDDHMPRAENKEIERLRTALMYYASKHNWINECEFKRFPGFPAAAVARKALGTDTDSEGAQAVALLGAALSAAEKENGRLRQCLRDIVTGDPLNEMQMRELASEALRDG